MSIMIGDLNVYCTSLAVTRINVILPELQIYLSQGRIISVQRLPSMDWYNLLMYKGAM